MSNFQHQMLALNRGLVSPQALARLDIKRLALAADIQVNWMSQTLGPMMFRPGFGYIGSTRSNAAALHVDFQFSQDDTAICELTDGNMRVLVDDVVVTRPAVSSVFYDWDSGSSAYVAGALATSTFPDSGDLAKWHDNDEAGGVSALVTGGMSLLGTGTAAAIRDRQIHVASPDNAHEHGITVVVARGQATIRIGTTEGGDDLLEDRTIRAGSHSFGITPGGTFYIRLSNGLAYAAVISSVTIAQAGGDMVLPTPWLAADLDLVRWEQSGDVIFVGCKGRQQKRIERQDRTGSPASRSWSVVEYAPSDGPFGTLNTGSIQLKGSALSGEINLTANRNFFRASHVGGLFRLTSAGQDVSQEITDENEFTNPIKVTGVGASGRSFTLTLTGPTFTGSTTVTLQRSIATPGTWSDVATYTGAGAVSIYDNLDNQIVYYRAGVKTGNFTMSDDLTAELTFSAGSIDGVVRVTGFTDAQNVTASVLIPLGAANTYTQDWYEGDWSPKNGYPSGVAISDGRLAWAGKGMEWLSVSDTFDSFSNDSSLGDSAAIRRFIGSGPVDDVAWLLALNFLLVGTAGRTYVAKASAIDEPLTPTKFSLKPVTSVGAAAVRALTIDTNGIFVSRNGSKIYEMSADANLYSAVPYAPTELTLLYPTIGAPGFTRCAVQRHPNTRMHFVRSDGKVVVIARDKAEEVNALLLIETDGLIEDVCVLPGPSSAPTEDQVYYTVKRTINGQTKRYLEKWAPESLAIGGNDNRMADSFVVQTGALGTAITGLSHLEAKDVVVWIDGKCPIDTATNRPKTYTVTGGAITVDTAVTSFICVGLPYTGQWRNAKLAVGSQMQAPLSMLKSVKKIGFVLANTHPLGLSYGGTFDLDFDSNSQLDDLPGTEDGEIVDPDVIWESYDFAPTEFDGRWSADPRICLEARAPLPATVMGMNLVGEGHDA